MSYKRLLSLLALILMLLGNASSTFAQQEGTAPEAGHEAEKSQALDIKKIIFNHVGDAHEWHFFTVGAFHATLPLPVILYSPEKGLALFSAANFGHEGHREAYNGYSLNEAGKIEATDGSKFYDFSITKNILSMLISVALLLIIMLNVAKKYKQKGSMIAPSGFQNAIEPVITFVRDEVARPNLGHKADKFMPLLLTFFFFIWINNLLGLLPGGANFTGNIAVTACLALITFIVMVTKANGHFWGHLLNPPGVPFGIKLLLVPIEIMSLFIKPLALAIRLFANILAGHIIILSIICMIFIFGAMSPMVGWGFSPVSIAFSIFMFLLELLVGAIQAFIFTTLTAVFIGQAVEEGHHEDHSHNDGHYHVNENEIVL
jgi:F-type H+-transporting ATPase subunit a